MDDQKYLRMVHEKKHREGVYINISILERRVQEETTIWRDLLYSTYLIIYFSSQGFLDDMIKPWPSPVRQEQYAYSCLHGKLSRACMHMDIIDKSRRAH